MRRLHPWRPATTLLVGVVVAACATGAGGLGSSVPASIPPGASSSSPPAPSGLPTPVASLWAEVDGLPVLTVSQAIAAREAGRLPRDRAAIRGYWSNGQIGHSCAPPNGTAGALELWCSDEEFGITELDEQIWAVSLPDGQVTQATGPHLTPYLDEQVAGLDLVVNHPQFINGQLYPPFPVVLLGHFNDARAAECRKEARERCRDRFVVDRIVQWEPGVVATPGITPTPTPFPSPRPAGLFEAVECAGDVSYSFVGWTTFEELGVDYGGYGPIWAAVSRDPVERSDEWLVDPRGNRYRIFGRVVCARPEWMDSGFIYASIPGTEETHWEDGRLTPGTPAIGP